MKLTLFALLTAIFATACTNTLYSHRADYKPVDRKGTWNDYYTAKKEGREWNPPKEEKQ